MENSEANKIIAEFMDFEYPVKNDSGFFMPNTDFMSLDALVPVWEKLSKEWHFEKSANWKGLKRTDPNFQ